MTAERVSRTNATPRRLGDFLARNPFPRPWTLGFFYREKMRAFHQVVPDESFADVLEVGGGRGGLTHTLLPRSRVTNIDMNPAFGDAPVNREEGVAFCCADATALPFADASFDAVTMFDVIEHVPDDRSAMAEAWRVLRPGGVLLVSTPHVSWRYPHIGFQQPWCPDEHELFAAWGHVRRGYRLEDLEGLVGARAEQWATFISAGTSLAHDLAWANAPERVRRALITLVAPITWAAYVLHRPHDPGTETAARWRKPRP
jgi:SAM-dependent methyltransferase